MLYTNVFVNKGIIYVRISGTINNITIDEFNKTINYLLYNIGVKYFVLDFINSTLEKNIVPSLNNKLLEAYEVCDKVVLKGLNNNLLEEGSY